MFKKNDLENNSTVLQEHTWYGSFVPTPGVDYQPAYEHARSQFSEHIRNLDGLDHKAEWVFGIGLAALGGLLAATQSLNLSGWACVPSLACFLLSMYFCLSANRPSESFLPPDPRSAIEHAEGGPESYYGNMAASIHVTNTGLIIKGAGKAKNVRYAEISLMIGAALALVPFLFTAS